MDARAGVGLPPGGPGGRLGLMSWGLASGRGSSLGLEFLEAVAVCHYYWLRSITEQQKIKPQSRIAHRDLTAEGSGPAPA